MDQNLVPNGPYVVSFGRIWTIGPDFGPGFSPGHGAGREGHKEAQRANHGNHGFLPAIFLG